MPARARLPIADADVARFVADGYLVVDALFDRAEVARLAAELVTIARGGYPCPEIPPAAPGTADREVLESLLCIHHPEALSPVVRANLAHPDLVSVLARIVGAHLPEWDGAVNCMQSMLFVKPPGKPGQAWHQDEMYIPTRDRSLCGAWIAIDEATRENGCLWVIPGSHRRGYLWPTRSPADLDEFDGSPECHGFDNTAAVPVEVGPGSVVFFNGYLLHRSLRNRSAIYRRALVHHYCNAWTQLPWHLRATWPDGTDVDVARANYRSVITVSGSDPYAHQGTMPAWHRPHLRTWGKAWAQTQPRAKA